MWLRLWMWGPLTFVLWSGARRLWRRFEWTRYAPSASWGCYRWCLCLGPLTIHCRRY
jgi:hypothetical protein